ncbi:MAG: hypothetical protein LRS48_02180 [Desulfurococcales archaeon]|nr:hypothetical protein [Desulfurococcales archaeon]
MGFEGSRENKGKISDIYEIGKRMIKSFASPLSAFVFDVRLIDSEAVSRIIALSGIENLVSKYAHNNIIIYYIDLNKIIELCRREDCRAVGPEKRRACVSSCSVKKLDIIKNNIIKSIYESIESITT